MRKRKKLNDSVGENGPTMGNWSYIPGLTAVLQELSLGETREIHSEVH